MSKLTKEIKSCMTDLRQVEGDQLSAEFCFPKEFIGFNGHFPGKPILPGVCKIQAIMLMLEVFKNKNARLKEITMVKFFFPVSSNQKININLEESMESEIESSIKATVYSEEKIIAKLYLKVAFLE